MKFAVNIVSALVALSLLLAAETNAEGVRGAVGREDRHLQTGNAGVTCITTTGADGVSRTVAPCQTAAPVTTAINEEGDEDDEDEESGESEEDSGESEDGPTSTASQATSGTATGSTSSPATGGASVTVTSSQGTVTSSQGTGTTISQAAAPPGTPNGLTPQIQDLPALPDVVTLASRTPDLTFLPQMISAAGLTGTLKGPGPFTVFAPINSAFPTGIPLLQLKMNPDLPKILTYHVVPGIVRSTDLTNGMTATTVQGNSISVGITGTQVKINEANVLLADIAAGNGIVHVIDTVLMPPSMTPNNPVQTQTPPVNPSTSTAPANTMRPMNPTTPGAGSGTSTVTTTGSTTGSGAGFGGYCSDPEFTCVIGNTNTEGVLVCRGGQTTCTPPTSPMMGDTCGCCRGDNTSPFCSGNVQIARGGGV